MSSHDAPRIPSSRSALESAPPPSAQSFVLAVAACRNALAHRPAGLITDVDGTISAIVSRPEDAAVLPGAAAALQVLVGRLDYLGVLSGRSPDVARVMVAVDGIDYIGLHGMAHWTPEGVLLHPEVQPYIGIMQQAAVAAGVMLVDEHIHLEEEGPILTVHYRGAPDEEEARSRVIAVLGQLAEERNLTVFEGRKVVELRPPLPFGKGWSLRDVATARGLASVVYLGDDRTDVEAFDALLEWREEAPGRAGVALGVASAEMPPALAKVADYLLAGVIEVQQLLLELAGSLVG